MVVHKSRGTNCHSCRILPLGHHNQVFHRLDRGIALQWKRHYWLLFVSFEQETVQVFYFQHNQRNVISYLPDERFADTGLFHGLEL